MRLISLDDNGVTEILSSLDIVTNHVVKSVLVFDLETLAAGFADPAWVPQKIMCAAWSWVGEKEVHVNVCGPQGFMGPTSLERRRKMLRPLLKAISEADVVCGHNLMRFDMRVLAAECMRLGLPVVGEKEVLDTMHVWKSTGFKKGLDNIAALLDVQTQKQSMSHQQWEIAYNEPGWPSIKSRAASDVQMTKEVRVAMLEANMLRGTTIWRP